MLTCFEVSVWVINQVKKTEKTNKQTTRTQSIYVANKQTWKQRKVNEESNIRQRITEAFFNQRPTLRNLLPRQLQEVVHLSPGDQRCLQSDWTSNTSKQTQQLTCLTCKTHRLKIIKKTWDAAESYARIHFKVKIVFYVLWYAVIKIFDSRRGLQQLSPVLCFSADTLLPLHWSAQLSCRSSCAQMLQEVSSNSLTELKLDLMGRSWGICWLTGLDKGWRLFFLKLHMRFFFFLWRPFLRNYFNLAI